MATTAPPRWDLAPIFAGLDDRAFLAALELAYADVDRLSARYDDLDIRACAPRPLVDADQRAIDEIITTTNDLQVRLRRLSTFLYAIVTTDSRNERAAALTVELQTRTAELGPLQKRLAAWCDALGAGVITAASEVASAHAFTLHHLADTAARQMSEAEESLAAQLAPSGSLAWARLHGDISSQLQVELRLASGEVEHVPMAMARGFATHPDSDRRRAAYVGELEAWQRVEVPLAAALNGAKGELAVLNQRRGWLDDIEPVLHVNAVDRVTLDAMTSAVVDALADFRRYFHAKAGWLGHAGGLPWWDLFAPVGNAAPVAWHNAAALVRSSFGGYSERLRELADRAFAEQWIDAEIRDGKRSGAYCAGVEDDVSRVMMNFDGSNDSVSTLAHELGHAYHNVALADRTPLQKRTPMALAETASIFCETLMFQTAFAATDDPAARLSLLDTHLVGAAQVVVDIHSRFLFESELCRRRRRTVMSPNELSAMMLDAQDVAYGDGLDPSRRHPYMWAVKAHYFTPFYNWPYTYGLLFGIGLFARYTGDPDGFRAGYDDLLASTGMADAAMLAARFDIDVRSRAFWDTSLDTLRRHIDEYVTLTGTVPRAGQP